MSDKNEASQHAPLDAGLTYPSVSPFEYLREQLRSIGDSQTALSQRFMSLERDVHATLVNHGVRLSVMETRMNASDHQAAQTEKNENKRFDMIWGIVVGLLLAAATGLILIFSRNVGLK